MLVCFNFFSLIVLFILSILLAILVAITTAYYVPYDEERQTTGLTIWSIAKAKEMFKGGKPNDKEGEKVNVHWKVNDEHDDFVHFSKKDMEKWLPKKVILYI